MTKEPQVIRELKRDELGRIELLEGPSGSAIRRVACGGPLPGSRWLARRLMRREKVSLEQVRPVRGVARILESDAYRDAPSSDGQVPNPQDVLLRSWLEGVPLHATTELALNFFDLLDALVQALHDCGVCHNDLHKEQNILVQADGYPAVIDFQLASVHTSRNAKFRKRAAEDLRHLQKHRRRYTRDGRGPEQAAEGAGHGLQRGFLARTWRKTGKPLYNFFVHRVGRKRESEPRRESSALFPTWTAELAAREPRSRPE